MMINFYIFLGGGGVGRSYIGWCGNEAANSRLGQQDAEKAVNAKKAVDAKKGGRRNEFFSNNARHGSSRLWFPEMVIWIFFAFKVVSLCNNEKE